PPGSSLRLTALVPRLPRNALCPFGPAEMLERLAAFPQVLPELAGALLAPAAELPALAPVQAVGLPAAEQPVGPVGQRWWSPRRPNRGPRSTHTNGNRRYRSLSQPPQLRLHRRKVSVASSGFREPPSAQPRGPAL